MFWLEAQGWKSGVKEILCSVRVFVLSRLRITNILVQPLRMTHRQQRGLILSPGTFVSLLLEKCRIANPAQRVYSNDFTLCCFNDTD